MTDTEIKSALGDRSVLMLTLWGEARGVSVEARIAVGCVVRNRLQFPTRYRATEASYAGICFAPQQFSCWNGGDANYAAIMAQAERIVTGEPILDLILRECGWIADGIRQHFVLDHTQGATFYVEQTLFQKAPPSWTSHVTQTGIIGPFVLFKNGPPKANV